MHILVVNDDGPPSQQSSPYVHSLIHNLQQAGHTVSVVLPNRQRSWIGKAHLAGATVKPTYFRPGTLHKDDGTVHDLPLRAEGKEDEPQDEWILVDSTPATCVQIGLYHYFNERGPIDLVVSGPNYGRNTTTVFALSSGTLGGALEAAVCGKRSIALSYAFSSRDHDPVVIAESSKHSVKLIEHLHENWSQDVDVYSINVPLEPGVSGEKILYTSMLQNTWKSGSSFQAIDAEASTEGASMEEHKIRVAGEIESATGERPQFTGYKHQYFKWAPTFADVYKSVEDSEAGNDGWAVKEGYTSVTPLRANFMHAPQVQGEIQLSTRPSFYALVEYQDAYVQPLILQALEKQLPKNTMKMISSLDELPDRKAPLLQWRMYEETDFEHMLLHPSTSLVNSYVIRKALIRKHYLSQTVETWITKKPQTSLVKHAKPTVTFELDYAEFLDDALIDCYELVNSFEENESKEPQDRQWWILKPGMSDRGQGIRLFDTEDKLREIFEEWEVDEPEDDEEAEESDIGETVNDDGTVTLDNGIVTSQLRHFIAQPYITGPLLLPSSGQRKFHIRTYVLAVGSLRVYVFREMLALFAERSYKEPWEGDTVEDLTRHLTNTCIQDSAGLTNENSVRRFWSLEDDVPGLGPCWKDHVYAQICKVTGEIFEAAARGMMIHFQTLPNAFELFGVDFLVDQTGNAWLLELNAFPDFKQTGAELRDKVVGRLFEGVVDAAIKPFFGMPSYAENLAVKEESELGMRLVAAPTLGKKT